MKELRHTILRLAAVMLSLLLPPCAAAAPVAAIGDYASESFAPVRGEHFSIPVHVNDPASGRLTAKCTELLRCYEKPLKLPLSRSLFLLQRTNLRIDLP